MSCHVVVEAPLWTVDDVELNDLPVVLAHVARIQAEAQLRIMERPAEPRQRAQESAPAAPPVAPAAAPGERLRTPALLRRLGISRSTLYRWSTAGDFPRPAVIGGTRLYDVAAVERWLRAREAPSALRTRSR